MQKNITFLIMPFFIICMWAQPIAGMNSLEEQPTEVFENITEYLSKNDIKNLRLVSKICKVASQGRWNSVKLYITFPDAYGIEQIGSQSWRITCDGQHSIVDDLKKLTTCPIPDCTSKYKNSSLPMHLRNINGNIDSFQQHDRLEQLLHFLYTPLEKFALHDKKYKMLKYASILNSTINKPDDIANNKLRNSELADRLMKQEEFTQTQKVHIITWFKNELTSLHKIEKKERQQDRLKRKNIQIQNRQQEELQKQEELEKEAELTRKKELEHQKPQAAKSTQPILGTKTRPTSPSELVLLQTVQTQKAQKKKSATPFAKVPIQIAIPRLNFTGYQQSRQCDLESEIEELQRLVTSAYTLEMAQNLVLLSEADTQLQKKKRGADFPEDEPAHKYKCF